MSSNLTGWADKLRTRGMMKRYSENRREDLLYYWAHATDEQKSARVRPMMEALRKIRPLLSRQERLRRKSEYNRLYYIRKTGSGNHPWRDAENARLEEIRSRKAPKKTA
jgi:hypothetical protein